MKIVAIIQARCSSTRLPGKILKDLPFGSGVSILEHVIRRVKMSKHVNEILVATTIDSCDDIIEEMSIKNSVKCFRGSKENVLERYYLAAKNICADIIIRITSDCPCIDYKIIDQMLDEFLNRKGIDYMSNVFERSYPHGLDLEIFTMEALEEAYNCAESKYEMEHVTPYIHTTKRDNFEIYNFNAPAELNIPDIRVTVDNISDYAALCAVFDFLAPDGNAVFDTYDLITLYKNKKWLKLININSVQKKNYGSIEEEIKDAATVLRNQEMMNAVKILEGICRGVV